MAENEIISVFKTEIDLEMYDVQQDVEMNLSKIFFQESLELLKFQTRLI